MVGLLDRGVRIDSARHGAAPAPAQNPIPPPNSLLSPSQLYSPSPSRLYSLPAHDPRLGLRSTACPGLPSGPKTSAPARSGFSKRTSVAVPVTSEAAIAPEVVTESGAAVAVAVGHEATRELGTEWSACLLQDSEHALSTTEEERKDG